jgi:hypothetical protein
MCVKIFVEVAIDNIVALGLYCGVISVYVVMFYISLHNPDITFLDSVIIPLEVLVFIVSGHGHLFIV